MADSERKRSVASKKKNATKQAAVKAVPKRAPRKRAARKVAPKSAPKKSESKQPKKPAENDIHLPQNMSVRSIEKSLVYQREFGYFYRNAMYKIAYASGLCFLLVGISYLSLGHIADTKLQRATVIESTADNILGAADSLVDNSASTFRLISDIPANITAPTQVAFEVTNAADVKVVVAPKDKFNGYSTELKKISDSKYSVTFSGPDKISAGYYTLLFFIKTPSGERYQKRSDLFFMGNQDVEAWYNKPVEAVTESGIISEESHAEPVDEISVKQEVTPEVINKDEIEPPEDAPSAENTDTAATTDEEALTLQLLTPPADILTGTTVLSLRTSATPPFVELYARSTSATTPTFVTLGVERLDRWVFQFDSSNLPNGSYAFFVKTKVDGKSVVSPSLTLRVANTVNTTSNTVSLPSTEDRPVITTADFLPSSKAASLPEVAHETDLIIKENEESINELLKRYATAKQAGDDSLVQAARNALSEEQERIAIKTTTNLRTRDISDSIDTELQERLIDLQDRIDTFESLRKEQSGGNSSKDSDNDGISDVDEVNLYKTDPSSPDTDGDGFADGIEIVRGYNPIDPAVEAVISFESPKESVGLVRDDVLSVTVTPVEVIAANTTSGTLNAEIRGTALPNSYVTIYIFSSPTVVTVRTDADGSFVYSFDKELEDGTHDVYVAITDNAGEILAQSSPFSFVKEAQAITPIAAAGAESVSPSPLAVTESKQSGYNAALGIGVLAFGLILFMLGISLRKRNEEIIVPEDTVLSDDTENV